MSTIRRYTKDFKNDAIQYVEAHPDMPMEQAAEHLGMPKETLYGWVKAYRRKLRGNEIAPSVPLTDEEKELARLRRENRDLQDALEVLKKAISILND
ncbi:MAG: transposase [Spirochaetaceae bacterium]|nr:transposase [Spirochaetaceae bacterium]